MKKIEINGVTCVIQSYLKDDYVNLSLFQDVQKTPFNNILGNIRITFYNNKITTEGKESAYWKEFPKSINITDIKKSLESIFPPVQSRG